MTNEYESVRDEIKNEVIFVNEKSCWFNSYDYFRASVDRVKRILMQGMLK